MENRDSASPYVAAVVRIIFYGVWLLSLCPTGLEFRAVLLVDWSPIKAKEHSLTHYLADNVWDREMNSYPS